MLTAAAVGTTTQRTAIVSAGKNKIGRDLILTQKEIDNLFFYVEEIRTKHKELAMQTFYIRKKPPKK